MKYFVKTPWWLKKLYPQRVWSIDNGEKSIYLTFDDGPDPQATTFVLDELKKYNAQATFFCIGKNVAACPTVYERILNEGHAVGNHTQHHPNGWKTPDDVYIDNVQQAASFITSSLFRPPYGRLRSSQAKKLAQYKIVMWDVLSGDFDESISSEKCLENVTGRSVPGSVIVFHDSQKAFSRLQYALPKAMEFFHRAGYSFKKLD